MEERADNEMKGGCFKITIEEGQKRFVRIVAVGHSRALVLQPAKFID